MDFYADAISLANKFGIDKSFLDRPLNKGLSGGEKKQSEVLQLLMLKPKFALLDEIDSGVDVDSLKKIQKAINHLKKNGTGLIIITHNPEMIKKIKPDFIHVMKGGKISRSGGIEILNTIKKYGIAS
jgi:Fe-S cluster assembly ATP-binding protein